MHDIYSNSNYVKDYEELWAGADTSGYEDMWQYARSFFSTDHALFCAGNAYLTSEFRNMESDYGILPYPKYNEAQEQYYSTVDCLASIFAIPATYRTDMSTQARKEPV